MWHFSFVLLNEISRGGKKPPLPTISDVSQRKNAHFHEKQQLLQSLRKSHYEDCNCNQCTAIYAQWRCNSNPIPLLFSPLLFYFFFSHSSAVFGNSADCFLLGTLLSCSPFLARKHCFHWSMASMMAFWLAQWCANLLGGKELGVFLL